MVNNKLIIANITLYFNIVSIKNDNVTNYMLLFMFQVSNDTDLTT